MGGLPCSPQWQTGIVCRRMSGSEVKDQPHPGQMGEAVAWVTPAATGSPGATGLRRQELVGLQPWEGLLQSPLKPFRSASCSLAVCWSLSL